MNKAKLIIVILLLLCGLLSAQGKNRYKALAFDNPGTKRILKNEAGSYFYYRSLPEKAMKLNTSGISNVELRSFSTAEIKNPQIVTIVNKNRQNHPLTFVSKAANGYFIYAAINIPIPKGTNDIQVICYERSVYLRAFNVLPPKPVKVPKLKNLVLKAHGGAMSLVHNGSNSDYYSFLPSQALKFSVNNGRKAVVYVRPRLLDRTVPKLGVYVNGKLTQTVEFDLKRTTKYHVQGINNLGIAKRIELPPNTGNSEIEIRAISDHLFIGKPVLVKAGK